MKHVFIINPAAGQSSRASDISDHLSHNTLNLDYSIYITTAPLDATRYVREWLAVNPGEKVRFYACGGDGTLNEVAAGAAGNSDASVTVYPCGSGNDYVKYYGGADAFLDINALVSAEDTPVDLMKIGDKYCVNVCNFGFDTTVAKTMIKVKRKKIIGGKRAYVTGVVTALLKAMKNECEITVDGERLNDAKILLCTIANGNYVGGSFKCAPRSVNCDGLLDICMIKKISRFRFIKILKPYTAGQHLDNPSFADCVVYRRGKVVNIKAPQGFSISVDGEIVNGTDFTVEIERGAVNFAVPKNAVFPGAEKSTVC